MFGWCLWVVDLVRHFQTPSLALSLISLDKSTKTNETSSMCQPLQINPQIRFLLSQVKHLLWRHLTAIIDAISLPAELWLALK